MDSDTIRLIGRNRVIDELLASGIDVAVPMRDKSFDLIAYADSDEQIVVCPMQVRCSSGRSFAIDQKMERVPNLLHAYVWGVGTEKIATYALTHREALTVAEQMGYSMGQTQKDLYSMKPSKNLVDLLDRFRMTPETWRKKLQSFPSFPS
jgi:hypothetical protein